MKTLLLVSLLIFAADPDAVAADGHPCGVQWPTLQVSVTTTTLLGNPFKLKTPLDLVKSYVVKKVKNEVIAAAAKRSEFIKQLKTAADTGKKYATYVTVIAEGFSTAGLIIDEITMEATFYCCDKEKMDSAEARVESLWIILKSSEAVTKTPTVYADTMVDLATNIVNSCPGKVVAHCGECN
jgi:hypothetical protein